MKPMLIGLTGAAGSGKDTVADYLCSAKGFTRYAYADPLRQEVAHAFGVDIAMLTDRAIKEKPSDLLALERCRETGFADAMRYHFYMVDLPRSPRWIMQHWGTDYRRKIWGDDYWIREADNAIADLDRAGITRIVVTDVRFEDEAAFIRNKKGQIWHLHRPDLLAVNMHISERGVAIHDGDIEIINSTTIGNLHTQVALMLGEKEAA